MSSSTCFYPTYTHITHKHDCIRHYAAQNLPYLQLHVHTESQHPWRENFTPYIVPAGVAALHQATNEPALAQTMLAFGNKFNWNMCVQLGGAGWNPDNQLCSATYAGKREEVVTLAAL